MIYFDNAATGGFKPRAVSDAAGTVIRYLSANPGRSGHRLALAGERIVSECRETLSGMFGCTADRTVFTKNCTEALNLAIFGTVKKGCKVVTTAWEHNSVLRPLFHLQKSGIISLDVVFPEEGKNIAQSVAERLTDDTCLLVATTVSNVTGEILPVKLLGALAKSRGITFLADGAQGAGHIPLNLEKDNISMLAVPAHKGLYGIMGLGALMFSEKTEIRPLIFGGTGSESFSTDQPSGYPERLEAGTLNLPAIAALKEGVNYIKDNVESFGEKLVFSTDKIITEIKNIRGVKCYSSPNETGIVAFKFDNVPSAEAADIFNSEYDVAVRGGLHCAPLAHKHLGTSEEGLIRASLSVQNGASEISRFLYAVKKISEL